jgi:hypothetical protein
MLASLMKFTCALSLSAGMAALTGTDSGQLAQALPSDAQPGACYAQVYVPPEYKTVTEPVKARGAYDEIEATPAQYELVVDHQPLQHTPRIEWLGTPVNAGRVSLAAEYHTVHTQQLLSSATTRTVYVTTAEYTEIEKTIKVRDAGMAWKRVNCDQTEGAPTAAPEAEPPAPAADDATPAVWL